MKKDSGYFHPACFQILFKRNWFKTSLSCPLTVTFPDLSGCLNCRWSPLVVSSIHPSASNSFITSFTLYLFIYTLLGAKVIKIIPFTTIKVIILILFNIKKKSPEHPTIRRCPAVSYAISCQQDIGKIMARLMAIECIYKIRSTATGRATLFPAFLRADGSATSSARRKAGRYCKINRKFQKHTIPTISRTSLFR